MAKVRPPFEIADDLESDGEKAKSKKGVASEADDEKGIDQMID